MTHLFHAPLQSHAVQPGQKVLGFTFKPAIVRLSYSKTGDFYSSLSITEWLDWAWQSWQLALFDLSPGFLLVWSSVPGAFRKSNLKRCFPRGPVRCDMLVPSSRPASSCQSSSKKYLSTIWKCSSIPTSECEGWTPEKEETQKTPFICETRIRIVYQLRFC